jgi:hypothetical protein
MIQDLKDLKKLFTLCRTQGITEFKMNGIEIKFGDLPLTNQQIQDQTSSEDPANPWANFPAGELTPEQLAFYSSGGRPEEDPDNKDLVS